MTGGSPHTFRCNLPARRARKGDGALTVLSTFGTERSVNVRIEDIARVFVRHLEGRVADLVDIAAFAYAADSSVARSGWDEEGATEKWVRDLRLEIGVRDVEFWRRPEVSDLLRKALVFLSGDAYRLAFEPLRADRARQEYLDFGPRPQDDWPFSGVDRVVMFSGGLDSLTGAVERAKAGAKLLLVSHRSVSRIDSRQQRLLDRMREVFPGTPTLRVPVWVNRAGARRSREFTQRTRSFLFWALGLTVGSSAGAGGVQFFENGVVSLNLPIADQVVGARASRTTHPLALHFMEQLSALVLDRPFAVENPFVLRTKTEVVEALVRHGGADLIQDSCSCTRTHGQRSVGWHCGCCSQCIDRRMAMIAAGATAHDPEGDYHVPVLAGARAKAEDQTMAVSYVRHALELSRMTADDLAERFNTEISRAARAFPDQRRAVADLSDLHVRHGRAVEAAIGRGLASYVNGMWGGDLPPTSLLGLVATREHLRPYWRRLAERVGGVLEGGVPRVCQSVKPKDEPHLQQICDGLLKAADENLIREFPYMRWASRMTKPDWSDEEALLWVELKYVRARADVRKATEEMAADITKYGDNGRKRLFVVYDPSGHIVDRDAFLADLARHEGVVARVIR